MLKFELYISIFQILYSIDSMWCNRNSHFKMILRESQIKFFGQLSGTSCCTVHKDMMLILFSFVLVIYTCGCFFVGKHINGWLYTSSLITWRRCVLKVWSLHVYYHFTLFLCVEALEFLSYWEPLIEETKR